MPVKFPSRLICFVSRLPVGKFSSAAPVSPGDGMTPDLSHYFDQVPGHLLQPFRQVDQQWQRLCRASSGGKLSSAPIVAIPVTETLGTLDADVVIAGGTLGIFLAASLQQAGLQVALMERGELRGRDQEWNISRQELQTVLELGLLTPEELETAIATEYNPARLAFHEGIELWVNNVLNVGVDPVYLLAVLKQRFLQAGGKLLEYQAFQSVTIHPDGVRVKGVGTNKQQPAVINAQLLIDAMGHQSPLAKQQRRGQLPDGVCLVVGSCAQGYEQNQTGDLIATITAITNQCQYFWEAFPARSGRTTYLFTYVDLHPKRLSLEQFFQDYFRLLPQYQNVDLTQLDWQRFLFGFFPAYRDSPLHFQWNRVLAVGDSAGAQSPVSFGGFGAMVRHLKRLTRGIQEALSAQQLDAHSLALLQPYQPNIGVTWLFQQTMSVPVERSADPQQINRLMSGVFAVMAAQGDSVLQPFLQDVIQFEGLTRTLPRVNPALVLPLLPQIGLPSLVDWLKHYLTLGGYRLLYPTLKPFWQDSHNFQQQRLLEAWQYGAGLDWHASNADNAKKSNIL